MAIILAIGFHTKQTLQMFEISSELLGGKISVITAILVQKKTAKVIFRIWKKYKHINSPRRLISNNFYACYQIFIRNSNCNQVKTPLIATLLAEMRFNLNSYSQLFPVPDRSRKTNQVTITTKISLMFDLPLKHFAQMAIRPSGGFSQCTRFGAKSRSMSETLKVLMFNLMHNTCMSH